MSALWDGKGHLSVSQFWGLALCSAFASVSEPLVTPRLIVSLGGRQKGGKKKKERKKSLVLT